MEYQFETKNLDQKLYRRSIEFFILHTGKGQLWKDMKGCKIILRPSELTNQDPYFYGRNGVGGYTDGVNKLITVYVNDRKDDLGSSFYPFIRSNMIPISHELCHAILIEKGRNERVPLRHDDWGGNKAGTMLPFFTAEVHDRHIEGRLFYYKLQTSLWNPFKLYTLQLQGLDIRDLV